MDQGDPFALAFSHACEGGVSCVTTAAQQPSTPASRFAVGTHSSPVCLVSLHKAYSRVEELQGPPAGSSALCFAPDGRALYAGGADGSLVQFGLDTEAGSSGSETAPRVLHGEQLLVPQPDQPNSPVAAVCPQPDGGPCLAVACGRLIKVVEQSSGKLLETLAPLTSEALALGWLGSDRLLAGHAAGYTVWQEDQGATGRAWREVLRHEAADVVYSRFAVAPSRIVAATCSNKKEVHVWRMDQWLDAPGESAASTPVVMEEYDSEVQHLAWDPHGRFLATSDGGTATIWDFKGTLDRPAHSIICGGHDQGSQITCLSFSSDGTILLTAGDDAKLVFFNVTSFSPGGIAQAQVALVLGIPPERLTSALWLDEERVVVAAAGGTLLCLRVAEPQQLTDPGLAGAVCHLSGVPDLAQRMDELTVADDDMSAPSDIQTPSPGMSATSPPTAKVLLAELRCEQQGGRAAANGPTCSYRAKELPVPREVTPNHSSNSFQGGVAPARVRIDRQPMPDTPQRRKELGRGAPSGGTSSLAGAGVRSSRGQTGPPMAGRGSGGYSHDQQQQHRGHSFTSGVMRPYSNSGGGRGGGPRSSSPARSSSSGKDSSGTGMHGMGPHGGGWVFSTGGASGPGWGAAMQQLPPGMAAFPQGLPFQQTPPGMPPGMLAHHPGMVPFYLPRPGPVPGGMPASGAGGGAGGQGGGPGGGASQMSPKAGVAGMPPPAAFLMPGPMAYPSGPMGYPLGMYPQQPQQLRQMMAMQAQAQYLATQHAAMMGGAPPPVTGAMAADGMAPTPMSAVMVGGGGVVDHMGADLGSIDRSRHDSDIGLLPGGSSSAAGAGTTTTLYVGNLAPAVDEYVLQTTFMYFGVVSNVQVIRDKTTGTSRGFGFVTFLYPPNAAEAMRQMNGKAMYGPYEGRQLKVAPSARKP